MTQPNPSAKITPRERVLKTSLRHVESDRTPMDFLATMEIWDSSYCSPEPGDYWHP